MTIANIILTSQNGGAEQVFIDYIKILQKLNYPVSAFIRDDAPYFSQLSALNITIKKAKHRFGYYDLFLILSFRKFLLEQKVKIVIAHNSKAISIAYKTIATIKTHKIIFIAVNHSNNIKRSLVADFIFSVNKQIFFKTIDANRTVNNSFIMPNALDLHNYHYQWQNPNLISKNTIILGTMSRLCPEKNIAIAIETLQNLKINYPQKKFLLHIAGSGSEKPKLQQLAKNCNVEQQVLFLDWCENNNFFPNIDIFLMLSQRETFGLVMLEATKYGKPVITTNTDGANTIFDKQSALFVDFNKPFILQFSNHIMYLLENPKSLETLVANSKNRLYDKFSFECLQENLQSIISKIYHL